MARVGAWLAPLSFLLVWLAPLPLEEKAHSVAALTAAVVVCWVTEVLPLTVTSLLIAPALIALGVCDAKTAFAPYADPLLFLFYASFFLAESMSRHGLDQRLANALLFSRAVGNDPARGRFALMAAGALLSMWIANTTATAIILPILMGTAAASARAAAGKAVSPFAGSLLAVAYACSVGGMGTPVGTPPNLLTMRMLETVGQKLGFLDWLRIGLPAALATFTVSYLVVRRLFPVPEVTPVVAQPAPRAWSRGERVTAIAFGLAVLGWMLPELLVVTGVEGAEAIADALPVGSVGLIATTLLFALRDQDGKAVLPWKDARNADWGVIMLFGGGIALGAQMFDSGLSSAIGRGFVAFAGQLDVWTLTAFAIVLTVIMSELTSNTATANMLLPIVIAIATEMKLPPIPPALGVGLGATCGFMLPVATGPNALVYGTGHLKVSEMVRTGFVFDLLCMLTLFVVLRVLCPLYGWS